MSDIVDTIIEVADRFLGNQFERSKAQLATIRLEGSHTRFLVSRMGSTGSTWLAKLLNSHPDVFCYHEGVIARMYPAKSYSQEEILSFIKLLAEDVMHGAYAAAGDVGSAWLRYLTFLPKGTFSTGLLVRHPARVLNTRLKVFPKEKSLTQINEKCLKCIEYIWNIDTSGLDDIDRVFLYDAFIFAGQIRSLHDIDVLIQIEKMNNAEYASRVAKTLTGQSYAPALLDQFIHSPLHSKVGPSRPIKEIVDSFSRSQRTWYELILGDILPRFGYSLLE